MAAEWPRYLEQPMPEHQARQIVGRTLRLTQRRYALAVDPSGGGSKLFSRLTTYTAAERWRALYGGRGHRVDIVELIPKVSAPRQPKEWPVEPEEPVGFTPVPLELRTAPAGSERIEGVDGSWAVFADNGEVRQAYRLLLGQPTDHLHRGTNDRTCSRCREPIAEGEVPILLWPKGGAGELLYQYCTRCAMDPDSDRCRVCGCTQNHACEEPCSWVEPGLCSSCAPAPRAA